MIFCRCLFLPLRYHKQMQSAAITVSYETLSHHYWWSGFQQCTKSPQTDQSKEEDIRTMVNMETTESQDFPSPGQLATSCLWPRLEQAKCLSWCCVLCSQGVSEPFSTCRTPMCHHELFWTQLPIQISLPHQMSELVWADSEKRYHSSLFAACSGQYWPAHFKQLHFSAVATGGATSTRTRTRKSEDSVRSNVTVDKVDAYSF